MRERHDPRRCDLYDTGTRTLTTILVILLTGVHIGIVFLLGQAVILITPMDPVAAHLGTCLGPPALLLASYPVIALIHLFRLMRSRERRTAGGGA